MASETTQADAAADGPRGPARKHALIIGVNAYPDSKGSKKPIGDLEGCVNDALLVKSVLKDKFGVPEAEQQELFAIVESTKGDIVVAAAAE